MAFATNAKTHQAGLLQAVPAVVSDGPGQFYPYSPVEDSAQLARLRRKGKWVKWLGIGSLAGLLVPLVNVLALPAAIISLVMGGSVKRQTEDEEILRDVSIGKKTSIASIILHVLLALLAVLIIVAFLSQWR